MAPKVSTFKSTLQPDPALVQNAGYRLDAPDRQYIDQQVTDLQALLSGGLLNGVVATFYQTGGSVTQGDVVCLMPSSTGKPLVVTANSANIVSAFTITGIALTSAASGAMVQVAIAGDIPPSITGLDGARPYVRVSTAGRCEEVVAYSLGDIPVGTVNSSGVLSLIRDTVIAPPAPETWPIVPTTDASVVNLLPSGLAVPASGTLRFRATIEAKLVSYATTWQATWTQFVKWKRDGTGAPSLAYVALIQDECSINANSNGSGVTWSTIDGPSTTVSISGAANNGSGLIRLTLSGAQTGFLSGASGTVAGVGGVPNATGTWGLVAVDSTHVDLVGSTWAGTYTSGGTITIAGVVSLGVAIGNAAQIQASGILPPPWVAGETFATPGAVRYDSVSGNTYIYTGTGTTSSRPTGTTTGSDGTLTYEFVATGQQCPISGQITDLTYATM